MFVALVGDMYQLRPVNGEMLSAPPKNKRRDTRKDKLQDFDVKVVELEGQVRAAQDPAHSAVIAGMRKRGGASKVAVEKFMQTVKRLSHNDGDFLFAPILVVSNLERVAINNLQVQQFAKHHNQQVLAFSNRSTASSIAPTLQDDFYFTAGAPAMITANIAPDLGIANGTLCVLHSLSYKGNQNQVEFGEIPGEIYRVPIPMTINVIVGERTVHLQMTKVSCESETNKETTRKTAFPVELAFSFTFHKAQGATLPRVILDLNKRPQICGQLQHASLYVGMSRVRKSSDIRLLNDQRAGFDYLGDLQPDGDVEKWLENQRVSF